MVKANNPNSEVNSQERWETEGAANASWALGCDWSGPGRKIELAGRITLEPGYVGAAVPSRNPSSVRYMGWYSAPSVPTSGPKGSKPMCS